MTQPNTNATAHVQENFARILETCRAAREDSTHVQTEGVASLLGTLSPGQMLKLAVSTDTGVDGNTFLKTLCAARLFEREQACLVAPEYNAHLALAA